MTRRSIMDRAANLVDEVQRYAAFDLQTRRFIAYAIGLVPELRLIVNREEGVAGNEPLPFLVDAVEAAEREEAYQLFKDVRAADRRDDMGRQQREGVFNLLLAPARVDVRYGRIKSLSAFIFLYERLAGPSWRQLLPLAWEDAYAKRRQRLPMPQFSATPPLQLSLGQQLVNDLTAKDQLQNDAAPWFFPSLADAEKAGGAPLLSML